MIKNMLRTFSPPVLDIFLAHAADAESSDPRYFRSNVSRRLTAPFLENTSYDIQIRLFNNGDVRLGVVKRISPPRMRTDIGYICDVSGNITEVRENSSNEHDMQQLELYTRLIRDELVHKIN